MSENPSEGVVDANCRVHGMQNLYVAGCSVFPTCANDMPTLTLMALAHRLADHLQAQLRTTSTTVPVVSRRATTDGGEGSMSHA